jgi:hypothetical protein
MRYLLAIAVIAVAVGTSGTGVSAAATAPCKGGDLAGSFRVVPDSPGAGGISYTLLLKNVSHAACFVSGLPTMQLLDKHGNRIPTDAMALHPGSLVTAASLAPGTSAKATARFSPDVPGVGEQHPGRCEPVASKLRVTPSSGHGSVVVPIQPATSVCEHGRMTFSTGLLGPA